jgi:hypothetical protein
MAWHKITPERYDEMLNVLPPLIYGGVGFLLSEPHDHFGPDGRARYAAFAAIGGAHYESLEPMTPAEYRAVTTSQILRPVRQRIRFRDTKPDSYGTRRLTLYWLESDGIFRPEPSVGDGQPIGYRRAQEFRTDPARFPDAEVITDDARAWEGL